MRALLILIAHDPSPVYFLGLIFKTTEIKVYLKHTSCGRPLGKFPTSSPPSVSPPSYRTYTLGTFATHQHTLKIIKYITAWISIEIGEVI